MFRRRAVAIVGVGVGLGKNAFAIHGVDDVGKVNLRGQ